MPISQIPGFESFLSSISLDHPAEEGRQFFEVIPTKLHFDGDAYIQTSAVSASYLPGDIKFDSALKRLGQEVRKSNHLANDSMLQLLLGMSAG